MHDLRLEKNMSLQELADKTNIDIERLKNFEAGERSCLNIIQYIEISQSLGVSLEDFSKGIQFLEE